MAKKEDTPDPAMHRMVPSPWVEGLREHWKQASETEVEVRVGTRGSWTPLPSSRMVVVDVTDADDVSVAGLAMAHAQTQYDRGWSFRDEKEKRCDAKLCVYQKIAGGVVKLTEITAGGRLTPDGAEDIPDDGGGFSPVSVWKAAQEERGKLVGHIESLADKVVDMCGRFNDLLEKVGNVVTSGDDRHAAEAFATAQAYRAERGFESLDKIMEKYEPVIRDWAASKKAETLLRTPRPKVGDPIIDAWNQCVTACDLPAAAMLAERFGDAGKQLVAAWAETGWSRVRIVDVWQSLRPSLKEPWEATLAACPGALRESLVALVVAITAAEKETSEKGESTVKEP
jgi:hypothetical protein